MHGFLTFLGALLGGWIALKILGALIVGAIARFLLPGKDKVGWGMTLLVGFIGGWVAEIVAHLAGWLPWDRHAGILGSLLGAMGLLLIYRVWLMFRGSGAKATPAPPSA